MSTNTKEIEKVEATKNDKKLFDHKYAFERQVTDSNRIKWRYAKGQRVNCVAYHFAYWAMIFLEAHRLPRWEVGMFLIKRCSFSLVYEVVLLSQIPWIFVTLHFTLHSGASCARC